MENKENNEKGKIRRSLDKLVMGMIIGGAIGSVLGMAFAPKKGKDTRKFIKEKGKELYEKHEEDIKDFTEKAKRESKSIFQSIKNKFSKNKDEKETEIPTEGE